MKEYYACKKCKRIIKKKVKECPYCGSKEISKNWSGLVIIIDKEKSEIAKLQNYDNGTYAIVVK